MVVATGRDEGGSRHLRPDLEAEHVAVRTRDLVAMSPTCRCRWPTREAGTHLRAELLTVDGRQQRVEVEPLRAVAGELLLGRGPLVTRTIGGELDAIAIGIGQVDRLVRAVVDAPWIGVLAAASRSAVRASSSRVGKSKA